MAKFNFFKKTVMQIKLVEELNKSASNAYVKEKSKVLSIKQQNGAKPYKYFLTLSIEEQFT